MRLASGSVFLEKFWMPGRASAIIASRLLAARSTAGDRLAQILRRRPALLVDQPVGAVGQLADPLGGDAGVARGDPRIADGVGKVGRALGEHPRGQFDIVEDVGDRILVLVAQQLGQPLGQPLDAVDQLRRAN